MSKESFDLLDGAKIITKELSVELKKMVRFRNIAAHDYREIDLDIVKHIIESKLDIFYEFLKLVNKM